MVETVRYKLEVRPLFGHFAQIRISGIYEDFVGSPLYIVVQFSLCLHDPFETPESEQVGFADIRDKPVVRQAD